MRHFDRQSFSKEVSKILSRSRSTTIKKTQACSKGLTFQFPASLDIATERTLPIARICSTRAYMHAYCVTIPKMVQIIYNII